jgi:hypothetical protein
MFLTHSEGSKNIAIIFPGGDNSTDVPTLHYARKAALLSGCDVLSIEYGQQIGYETLSQPEIINTVVQECWDVIARSFIREYGMVFLICKSIGHFISFKIDEMIKEKNIRHICYTPISANVEDIKKRQCLVFTGNKDKFLADDDRKELINCKNIEVVQIENAVHSLEIDDNFIESIKILGLVTEKCSEYVRNNIVKS